MQIIGFLITQLNYVCACYSDLAPLLTIFQSYHDSIWYMELNIHLIVPPHCGFEPHWGRRVVSLSKTYLPPKSTGNTQEAVAPSQHDWKIVYRDVKHQTKPNQTKTWLWYWFAYANQNLTQNLLPLERKLSNRGSKIRTTLQYLRENMQNIYNLLNLREKYDLNLWYICYFWKYIQLFMNISLGPGKPVVIMITCPCDVDPLTPHFYIVKLGFTGVFIFFLFLL